jgi:sugar phosphate isomerase/epimerase
MFAFSTCWNSARHTDGYAMLEEIRALGFDTVEIGHGTSLALVDGIQKAVAEKIIRVESLHNFCPLPPGVSGPAPDLYSPASRNEGERGLAVRHTLRTIDFAGRLGARVVVLHLGYVKMRAYTRKLLLLYGRGKLGTPRFERIKQRALLVRGRKREKFLSQLMRSLEQLLPAARQTGVKLAMETRFCIEEIPSEDEIGEILAKFSGEPIGYWHDIGHAVVKETLGLSRQEEVLEAHANRLLGMHLQDVGQPGDDHLPPAFGTFDFSRISPFARPEMTLTWEIHPRFTAEQIAACVPPLQKAWKNLWQYEETTDNASQGAR